jgi:putative inorganic carbon (HCO3(-)) transporter
MIVTDFPFTGIGFGNFSAVTDLFYPFLVAGEGQPHAHNLLLQIAVDIGVFGLIAWLACLAVVLVCCVQALRVARVHQNLLMLGICVGLLCGQFTMLVHGLTDAPLWATRPALLVWVLWGIALALPVLTEMQSVSDTIPEHS